METRVIALPLSLPRIRTAGRFPLGDRGFTTVYSHNVAHALHLHDYRGRWRCAGTEYRLEAGTITLSPLGIPTAYDLDAAGRHWCSHFEPGPAGEAVVELPLLVRAGPAAAYARERFARLAALYEGSRRGDAAAAAGASATLLELLIWIGSLAEERPHGDRGGAAAERAATLIREHPERAWSTGQLARRIGVSAAWLATGFRDRFAMTIARYALVQRVERARVLLSTTALPVAEIGILVGLPDPQHFNKRFRAVAGQAPSACRGRLDRM